MKKYFSLKITMILFLIISLTFSSLGLLLFSFIRQPSNIMIANFDCPEENILGDTGDCWIETDLPISAKIGNFGKDHGLYWVFLPAFMITIYHPHWSTGILSVILSIAYFIIIAVGINFAVCFLWARLKKRKD